MPKRVTVNKIGGDGTSQMTLVLDLINVLKADGETPVSVASAFRGVTNELSRVLDRLSETDYSEASIREAFKEALEITNGKIEEFIKGEPFKTQAKDHVQRELDICIQTLMTHKRVTGQMEPLLAPSDKTYQVRDKIIAFGERSVIGILEAFLQENNVTARAINDAQYQGDDGNSGRKISRREIDRGIRKGLAKAIAPHKDKIGEEVLIIGGHVGNVLRGMIPERGRSYTDATAVDTTLALERNLGVPVEKTVIWKRGVDGILSSDPKQLDETVNTPIVHPDMSLREAMELPGSVIHSSALRLALKEGVSLTLKNIEKPRQAGTTLGIGESISEFPFKIVTSIKDVDIVSFQVPEMAMSPGFLIRFAEEFKDISINDVLTAETSISFTINLPSDDDKAEKEKLREAIRTKIANLRNVEIDGEMYECNSRWDKSKANVVVIGDELAGTEGILSVVCGTMTAERINIGGMTQDTDQKRISFYINKKYALRAVRALHKVFIDKNKEYTARTSVEIKDRTDSFLT